MALLIFKSFCRVHIAFYSCQVWAAILLCHSHRFQIADSIFLLLSLPTILLMSDVFQKNIISYHVLYHLNILALICFTRFFYQTAPAFMRWLYHLYYITRVLHSHVSYLCIHLFVRVHVSLPNVTDRLIVL